jgi:hypothetical protein
MLGTQPLSILCSVNLSAWLLPFFLQGGAGSSHHNYLPNQQEEGREQKGALFCQRTFLQSNTGRFGFHVFGSIFLRSLDPWLAREAKKRVARVQLKTLDPVSEEGNGVEDQGHVSARGHKKWIPPCLLIPPAWHLVLSYSFP